MIDINIQCKNKAVALCLANDHSFVWMLVCAKSVSEKSAKKTKCLS